MEFREAFITNKGQELFARAAGNSNTGEESPAEGIGKIIWGDALTSSLDSRDFTIAHMQGLTLNDLKRNNGQSSSGTATSATVTYIPAASVEDRAVSKVVVECELSNSQYYGYANTFGICAKVDGDSGYVLAVVARCGKDDQDHDIEPSYINQKSSDGVGFVKFTVDFTINFSSGALTSGIADAPDSYYASASNLQKLSERVVTTHSASDNNIGDNQTILGEKTFQDPSVFNNSVTFTTADEGSSVTFDTDVFVTDQGTACEFRCQATAIFSSNVIINSPAYVKGQIGNTSNKYNVYTNGIYITGSNSGDILANDDKLVLNSQGGVIPGGPIDFGSSNSRWNTMYATTFNGTTFTGTSEYAKKLCYSGSSSVLLQPEYTSNVYYVKSSATLYSDTTSRNLGKPGNKWGILYCTQVGASNSYVTSAYITTVNCTTASCSTVNCTTVNCTTVNGKATKADQAKYLSYYPSSGSPINMLYAPSDYAVAPVTSGANLGATDRKFGNIYTDRIEFGYTYSGVYKSAYIYGEPVYGGGSYQSYYLSSVNFKLNGNVHPDSRSNLGKANSNFGEIYSYTVACNNATIASEVAKTISGNGSYVTVSSNPSDYSITSTPSRYTSFGNIGSLGIFMLWCDESYRHVGPGSEVPGAYLHSCQIAETHDQNNFPYTGPSLWFHGKMGENSTISDGFEGSWKLLSRATYGKSGSDWYYSIVLAVRIR